jgi:hypothetical protein
MGSIYYQELLTPERLNPLSICNESRRKDPQRGPSKPDGE